MTNTGSMILEPEPEVPSDSDSEERGGDDQGSRNLQLPARKRRASFLASAAAIEKVTARGRLKLEHSSTDSKAPISEPGDFAAIGVAVAAAAKAASIKAAATTAESETSSADGVVLLSGARRMGASRVHTQSNIVGQHNNADQKGNADERHSGTDGAGLEQASRKRKRLATALGAIGFGRIPGAAGAWAWWRQKRLRKRRPGGDISQSSLPASPQATSK